MSTLLLASSGLRALTQIAPPASRSRLGFVATAAELAPSPDWIERDSFSLRRAGYSVTELKLSPGNEDELRQVCESLDVIFVAGGNTYYLLQQVRASGFDAIVNHFIDRGGVYSGSSAGAMIAGPDIDVTAEPDQKPGAPLLTSTEGLGLVPFAVLPHVNSKTTQFFAHQLQVLGRVSKHPITRITDDEAVLVQDGVAKVVWSPMLP